MRSRMPDIYLFETENGLTVNEINHTMEFRNSITATGVNIRQKMVEYVLEQAAITVSSMNKIEY